MPNKLNASSNGSNTIIHHKSKNVNYKKELSTRRTLHADVNARKGANGELFIHSISLETIKINTFYVNSSSSIFLAKSAISLAVPWMPRVEELTSKS